jgi:hypothetical protein
VPRAAGFRDGRFADGGIIGSPMTRRLAGALAGLLLLSRCAGSPPPAAARKEGLYVGFISESDCGTDHAAMLATGKMGSTDPECTLKCVRQGSVFGFVDADRKTFYQLDDQEKPRPFAGRRVRITGRIEGDTLYVRSIEADNP